MARESSPLLQEEGPRKAGTRHGCEARLVGVTDQDGGWRHERHLTLSRMGALELRHYDGDGTVTQSKPIGLPDPSSHRVCAPVPLTKRYAAVP